MIMTMQYIHIFCLINQETCCHRITLFHLTLKNRRLFIRQTKEDLVSRYAEFIVIEAENTTAVVIENLAEFQVKNTLAFWQKAEKYVNWFERTLKRMYPDLLVTIISFMHVVVNEKGYWMTK